MLTRLQQVGYVRRGKSGPRGRAEYEITASGRSFLRNNWRSLMDEPVPSDIESIFRVAALALFSGAERATVSNYLKTAAQHRQQPPHGRGGKLSSDSSCAGSMGALYDRMRQVHATARLNTEAKLLRNLAVQIKKQGHR